jgi:hypothetical protein
MHLAKVLQGKVIAWADLLKDKTAINEYVNKDFVINGNSSWR